MSDPFGDPFGGPAPAAADDVFGGFVRRPSSRDQLIADAVRLMDKPLRFRVEKCKTQAGILMQVMQKDDEVGSRRIMVKAAYPEVAAAVQKEQRWVMQLQCVKHIVNPLNTTNDPMNPVIGPRWMQPYFYMEFLENGTLKQFQQRFTISGRTLPDGTRETPVMPNRLLWSIFLCLIRACVGMAWPPLGPVLQLEFPREEEPLRLAHSDMHHDNLMFGPLEPQFDEHARVPVMKLIDFGEAKERPPGDSA
ncbi:Uu.00g011560.m01.CDS01, partial [Anthostomella pinea]